MSYPRNNTLLTTSTMGKQASRIWNFLNRTTTDPYCYFLGNCNQQPLVKKDIEVDNFVIGGGIGGTYLSARLVNFEPSSTLLLVDKLNDYGGLMTSSKVFDTDTYIDLGPIRFYESIHPRVHYLSQKYNLSLTQYLPDSSGQICYLRDKKFNMANVFPDSDNVYNIRDDEKNINPFNTLYDNLLEHFQQPQNLYLLETRIELYKNTDYSNSVFQSKAQKNISQENWQRIEDVLGYNDLFSVKINFITDSLETLSLTNQSSVQYRFTEGYSILPKTIASNNNLQNITFNNINAYSFDIQKYNSLFNTAVLDISFSQKKKMWAIVIGSVSINSPEDISYSPTEIKTIYAKKIYSTIPLLYLKNIHKFSNSYLNICENSFVNFQIMRIFLRFNTDWLSEMGIGFGKSVTTLNGAQLIHYDDKILMFYAFNTQTSKLFDKLPNNIQIQKQMIEPTIDTQPLIDECLEIISKSYGVDKENLPEVNGIAYASWIHPIRCFSGRNLQNLSSRSLYEQLIEIMFPYGINGNFYVMENNSSFNTAWCEGSLEIVDFFMNYKYNQVLFGEDLIN
jgi:hypothetical protein